MTEFSLWISSPSLKIFPFSFLLVDDYWRLKHRVVAYGEESADSSLKIGKWSNEIIKTKTATRWGQRCFGHWVASPGDWTVSLNEWAIPQGDELAVLLPLWGAVSCVSCSIRPRRSSLQQDLNASLNWLRGRSTARRNATSDTPFPSVFFTDLKLKLTALGDFSHAVCDWMNGNECCQLGRFLAASLGHFCSVAVRFLARGWRRGA